MSQKDFLNQFSEEGKKPDSFKEEVRIPIEKKHKPFNFVALLIVIAIVLILAIGSYFLFFAPNIEMQNFVGKNKSDVSAWVKQQGIETSGIVFEEEYVFESEEGTILNQSIEDGTKIKKDAKINFVVSLGPDPNELIDVPDLKSMSKQEIQDWIAENKLTKSKVVSSYSDSVEEGKVIEMKFSNCDETNFTRSSSLNISISKGKEPAKEISMINLVGKKSSELSGLESTYKIKFDIKETYSDSIEEGIVISQSIKEKEKVTEGSTITVYVSKGKATYMPNLYGYSESDVNLWCSKNGVTLYEVKERYSSETAGKCIGQSIDADSKVEKGEYLLITMSLGPKVEIEKDLSSLSSIEEAVAAVNALGGNISIKTSYDFSDSKKVDEVISYNDSTSINGSISVVLSNGKNVWLPIEGISLNEEGNSVTYKWADALNYNESQIRCLCENSGVTYKIEYVSSSVVEANKVVSVFINENTPISDGMYVSQRDIVVVKVSTGA